MSLDKAAEGNVVFNYSTIEGTAAADIDYASVADQLVTINAGETTATIELTIKGDDIEEGDETFEVAILNPVGATFNNTKITVTIQDEDVAGGLTIPTSGYTTPLTYAGYTLTWQDEFDGTSLSSDWTHETGRGNDGWGNWELQYYRPENTIVSDGYLIIEAKEQSFSGANYTSSRIKTEGKQFFKYGRIDIRAALPEGQGIWPALWMLGESHATVGWPACGEIDIMEIKGHDPNRLIGTAHWQDPASTQANNWANFSGNTLKFN